MNYLSPVLFRFGLKLHLSDSDFVGLLDGKIISAVVQTVPHISLFGAFKEHRHLKINYTLYLRKGF